MRSSGCRRCTSRGPHKEHHPITKKSAITEPDDHALTDTDTCPIALSLTTGKAGGNPQLLPLIDGYLKDEQTVDTTRDIQLLADKAYSHPTTRAALRRRGIKHTIPERNDQISRRKAKASAGGRPPTFDTEIYKQRNIAE